MPTQREIDDPYYYVLNQERIAPGEDKVLSALEQAQRVTVFLQEVCALADSSLPGHGPITVSTEPSLDRPSFVRLSISMNVEVAGPE